MKVQLLQKAAFGEVDVEKGLAAFHVSFPIPLLCYWPFRASHRT